MKEIEANTMEWKKFQAHGFEEHIYGPWASRHEAETLQNAALEHTWGFTLSWEDPASRGPTTLGRPGCRAAVRGSGVAQAPACPTWRVPGEVHGGLALHRISALSEFHHTRQGDRRTTSSAGAL